MSNNNAINPGTYTLNLDAKDVQSVSVSTRVVPKPPPRMCVEVEIVVVPKPPQGGAGQGKNNQTSVT